MTQQAGPARFWDGGFALRLRGEGGDTRAGLAAVLAALRPDIPCTEDHARIELVLAEALNNIREHAFERQTANRSITVAGQLGVGRLRLTLMDRGRPMPGLCVPRPSAPDTTVATADLPEGGFGWLLIHSLSEDVRYARRGRQNRLMITLRLNR